MQHRHEFSLAGIAGGRSVTAATDGMVASAHYLASAEGLRVLQTGGNAIDAALAAAAVTWVTMPMMCGPGGDAFLLIYWARTGETVCINGLGPAGAKASPDFFRERGYRNLLPQEGWLSASVPGAVAAFEEAVRRWGTRGWDELLQTAIRYAQQGHPVSEKMAGIFARFDAKVAGHPETAAIYRPLGRPLKAGELLVQADLARSLRRLAAGWAEEFYQGELGAALARPAAAEGIFDAADLGSFQAELCPPISTTYREYEICQTAPPSQGMILLEQMNILEGYDLRSIGDTAEAHHLMVEAKKLAFADRNRWAGDPRFVDVPLAVLLSKEHAAGLRARIGPSASPAAAAPAQGETTYLCTADRDGNAVSLVHSLSNAFGAGVVAPGTGILLNNRAGRGFHLADGHPNQVAPGKRTISTNNCFLIMKGGRPVLVGGTAGADGQPQWNMQAIVGVFDFGLNVQQAVEAPRWTHEPGTDPALLEQAPVLSLESRFPPALIAELQQRGHPVSVIGPWEAGSSLQLIQVDRERGVLYGGADPRKDSAALGF
jgi:gamma-glutamyltranspeptidase / glutathione hydrolase